MIRILLFIIIFLLHFLAGFSQSKNKTIYGKVTYNGKAVKDVHVINLNTNIGTISNDNGEFKMLVALGDQLQISSIQYKKTIVTIANINLKIKKIKIHLKEKIELLDEFVLKKHNLKGFLDLDIKQTPKDTIGNLVMGITNGIINMKGLINMPIGKDEQHLTKVAAPSLPNSFSGGIGGSVSLDNAYIKKEREIKNSIDFKTSFPDKLISELGRDFFIKNLTIPKDKIYHFIDYCTYKNIRQLYKKKKMLQLIKILQEQSKSYLKTNKKE